jgi:tRNA nucleotidyltransferase (CCA-adding enzyme)
MTQNETPENRQFQIHELNEDLLTVLQKHPQWAAVEFIHQRLARRGHKAFLAGGCVRDALLGKQAHDIDIASDASPDQIETLFEKTINVGKVFGVMRVIVLGADVEVATFRHDGVYKDGRRPEQVTFSSPQDDAERRDFTINVLFYDLESHQMLDFVGGQKDLQLRLIKTVGDACLRFREDHLRLLRGARFAAQLGFSLEQKTLLAMTELAPLVQDISGERLREELAKIFKAEFLSAGFKILSETGLLRQLFPWWNDELATEFCKEAAKNPSLEEWQRWSLFFRLCSEDELELSLKLLRFSSKDRGKIEEAWRIWHKPETFFMNRMGKKVQLVEKPGVHWALLVLERQELWQIEIKALFSARQKIGEILPKSFLQGDDLKQSVKAQEIGRLLQESYCLQLEGKLQGREMALAWLKIEIEKSGVKDNTDAEIGMALRAKMKKES